MNKQYFEFAISLLNKIEISQSENMTKAAKLIAKAIMNGGILQTYGSGHSYAAAIELCGRAGGLIPSKVMNEPSRGIYERIEGVGELYLKTCDIQKDDVFIVISNSGRNPLPIEIAQEIKKVGASLIVVTSLTASKSLSSRHNSGKMLFEFGDVVLDTEVPLGDASLSINSLDMKISGTSTVTSVCLLNQVLYEAIEMMVEKGYKPPIYMSDNVDGGIEFNEKLIRQYAHRIYRN